MMQPAPSSAPSRMWVARHTRQPSPSRARGDTSAVGSISRVAESVGGATATIIRAPPAHVRHMRLLLTGCAVLIFLAALGFAAVMGAYAYYARDLPDPGTLAHRQL